MATQAGNRPISPHLQVYRPQITSVLSILHRMTGVALAFGLLLLTYWLGAAAYGAEAFAQAQGFMGAWYGQLLLFGFTVCLFYHLCNGVRHLAWDAGKGLELNELRLSGWIVLVAAVVLSVLLWVAVLASSGGA